MAQTSHSIPVRRMPVMKATAAWAITAVLAAWSAPGAAQTSVGAGLPMAELEKAFWVCDHAASTSRVGAGAAIACAGLTDTLKLRKFNGDFHAMLAWWRERKESEHGALAAANGRDALARLAPASSR